MSCVSGVDDEFARGRNVYQTLALVCQGKLDRFEVCKFANPKNLKSLARSVPPRCNVRVCGTQAAKFCDKIDPSIWPKINPATLHVPMNANVTLNARDMAAGVLKQLLLILDIDPAADFGWKAADFQQDVVERWDLAKARQYTLQHSSGGEMSSVRLHLDS